MRIGSIDDVRSFQIDKSLQSYTTIRKSDFIDSVSSKDIPISMFSYFDSIEPVKLFKTVQFKGHTVHIVDGGIHAKNMQYFANFLKKDLKTIIHEVDINPKDKLTKQLKSLELQLILLNKKKLSSDDYVAIPALASVPLLNIYDQYIRIYGRTNEITPENVKSKKNELLQFLKLIYDNPDFYRKYINYMDPIGQGIEYTYGIIEEINKLVNKKVKVYIPSGHPTDATLKWMAEERGLKPELYHYIATGEDINNSVKNMQDEIKNKNWYSFNLLTLSDANVVGIKDVGGKKDYIFAAYDSCVTESARGTYNLTPLRENDKVIGYSFSDNYTNDYPYEEFPMNKEVNNLLKFVGKDKKDLIANDKEIDNFLSNRYFQRKNEILYPVEKIFSLEEIAKNKINLLGKYVDSSLELFFDENKDGKIIFKNCDCEGSGRPSVLSVWGSCYAVFNAIARDINSASKSLSDSSLSKHITYANWYRYNNPQKCEKILEEAALIEKEMDKKEIYSPDRNEVYIMLSEIYEERKDYKAALGCLNRAMYVITDEFFKVGPGDLVTLKKEYDEYLNSIDASLKYDKDIDKYNNLFFIEKIFEIKPTKPQNYNVYKYKLNVNDNYQRYVEIFLKIYSKIKYICELTGETYPAKVCAAAINDIKNGTSRGNEVLKRQANKIQYIGDLYDEIRPN